MKDDEIIREVRRARAKIFKECGGTLEGLYAHIKELEKKYADKLVRLPSRRVSKSSPKAA